MNQQCPKCKNTKFTCNAEVDLEIDFFGNEPDMYEIINYDYQKDTLLTCNDCGEEWEISDLITVDEGEA